MDRNYGTACGHGFQKNDSLRLRFGGEQKSVGRMEIMGYLGIGNPSGKHDLASDSKLLCQILKRLFPRPIPDYQNAEAVSHQFLETGGSPQQKIEILLLFQARSRGKQPRFSV